MNVPVVVDRTSTGKEHFEVLDGLRGSAAFLIVIFHVFNYTFGFRGPFALVHHAYLAVDFFFALSGFVVAYAYDDRWKRMSILQFFRIRLIRLHPLVLIGATLGLLGYIFDPFSKAINHTDAPILLLSAATRLEAVDAQLARDTYLQAFAVALDCAAIRAGHRSTFCARTWGSPGSGA